MDLNLKNKYALVTGGGRGIGRSIALALAKEGCNVAICALEKEEVEKTVDEIKSMKVETLGVTADTTISENPRKVVREVIDKWGNIHILINNIGGGGSRVAVPVEKIPEKTWVDVYKLNALMAARFTMEVIPLMKKNTWGRVVTIASLQGREGGGRPWYNMAKSAEISLMKTLAMNPDLTKEGITFNSIAPGAIIIKNNEWDILRKEKPEEFKKMISSKPIGRLGAPEEVANVVAFLCSAKASLVNGACIAVDGGESRSF